jgi:hypothetical protein
MLFFHRGDIQMRRKGITDPVLATALAMSAQLTYNIAKEKKGKEVRDTLNVKEIH